MEKYIKVEHLAEAVMGKGIPQDVLASVRNAYTRTTNNTQGIYGDAVVEAAEGNLAFY